MTDKPPVKLLAVITTAQARARVIGGRFEVEPAEVLWVRSAADLVGYESIPLYVDMARWEAPLGSGLPQYIEALTRAAEARSGYYSPLAPYGSLALN